MWPVCEPISSLHHEAVPIYRTERGIEFTVKLFSLCLSQLSLNRETASQPNSYAHRQHQNMEEIKAAVKVSLNDCFGLFNIINFNLKLDVLVAVLNIRTKWMERTIEPMALMLKCASARNLLSRGEAMELLRAWYLGWEKHSAHIQTHWYIRR